MREEILIRYQLDLMIFEFLVQFCFQKQRSVPRDMIETLSAPSGPSVIREDLTIRG